MKKNKYSWKNQILVWLYIPLMFLFVLNVAVAMGHYDDKISVDIVQKKLPEAIQIIAQQTNENIGIVGSIKSDNIKSLNIKNLSFNEAIIKILKHYKIENHIIYFDKGSDSITIFLFESASNKNEKRQARSLDNTTMFSKENFRRLLSRKKNLDNDQNDIFFSEDDFSRLMKRTELSEQDKEFSEIDFARLQESNIEPDDDKIFSEETFIRLQNKEISAQRTNSKVFSEDDFNQILKNKKIDYK